MDEQALKYPIGPFKRPETIHYEQFDTFIATVEGFPQQLLHALEGLSEQELSWQYRPNGWTIRQVVHHCADSHLNAFIRVKLALTEEHPTIKPYYEGRWAELPDAKDAPVAWSTAILSGVHARWALLLKSLDSEQLSRTLLHPEHNRVFSIKDIMALYNWHCQHHLAHVVQAKKFKGQFS